MNESRDLFDKDDYFVEKRMSEFKNEKKEVAITGFMAGIAVSCTFLVLVLAYIVK